MNKRQFKKFKKKKYCKSYNRLKKENEDLYRNIITYYSNFDPFIQGDFPVFLTRSQVNYISMNK